MQLKKITSLGCNWELQKVLWNCQKVEQPKKPSHRLRTQSSPGSVNTRQAWWSHLPAHNNEYSMLGGSGSLWEAGVLKSIVRNHYISKTNCLADIKFLTLKKKTTPAVWGKWLYIPWGWGNHFIIISICYSPLQFMNYFTYIRAH